MLSVKRLLAGPRGRDPRGCESYCLECRQVEKGEPHDVIPMHMGHEEVIDLGCARAVLTHDLLPKAAQP